MDANFINEKLNELNPLLWTKLDRHELVLAEIGLGEYECLKQLAQTTDPKQEQMLIEMLDNSKVFVFSTETTQNQRQDYDHLGGGALEAIIGVSVEHWLDSHLPDWLCPNKLDAKAAEQNKTVRQQKKMEEWQAYLSSQQPGQSPAQSVSSPPSSSSSSGAAKVKGWGF